METVKYDKSIVDLCKGFMFWVVDVLVFRVEIVLPKSQPVNRSTVDLCIDPYLRIHLWV